AVMKEYGNMDIRELAMRFRHPLIQRAIMDYMPPGYQAYAFLVSYGTVTKGNDATTHLSLLYCVYNCVCDIL
nr:hypothetical protein [Lachnospiraceae bacterium]